MTQILLSAALGLIVVLWLTFPLWRGAARGDVDRERANVNVFRSRSEEIGREQAAGLLDAETASELLGELRQRVLSDAPQPARRLRFGRNVVLALALTVVVGAGATTVYLLDDSWRQTQLLELSRTDAKAARLAAARAMIAQMEKTLARNAEDDALRIELAQAYVATGRPRDAIPLFAELNARVQNPDWMVAEAEARMALDQTRASADPQAQRLLEQAVAIAPGNGKALWYSGLIALETGDLAKARERWSALARLDVPPEMRKLLQARIDDISARIGPAPADGGEQIASASASLPETRITLRVRLDAALAADSAADATLFVFARAPTGPPMPLAVHRGRVADLPATIALDDSMSMLPTARLSQFDEWDISARISRSGQALPAAGDLQGSRRVKRAELGSVIELTIDTRLP